LDASILTEAVKIGKPTEGRYPSNDYADCYARSVWDMQYYNGKIYIGSGDYTKNRGPIDIWSFADDSGSFIKEITVPEEQISTFYVYDRKLYSPGDDPRGSNTGAIYVKDNAVWEEIRTIPSADHVFGFAPFDGDFYAYISRDGGQFLKSSDMGQTWTYIMTNLWEDHGISIDAMVPFDDFLLIMGKNNWIDYLIYATPCIWKYTDESMEELEIPLFSPEDWGKSERVIRYSDGVLYINSFHGTPSSDNPGLPRPLFFLNDFANGVDIIEEFSDSHVRDILVRGANCYILTASPLGEDEAKGCIYSSSDLDSWTKLAEFSVPGLPYSFELLDDTFYVGLGRSSIYSGIESGSIYKIIDSNSAPIDVIEPGVANASQSISLYSNIVIPNGAASVVLYYKQGGKSDFQTLNFALQSGNQTNGFSIY